LYLGKAAMKGGKAMRVALISSGIGAVVALIGLLVQHWETIGEFLGFINKDLEKQVELNERNLDLTEQELTQIDLRIKLGKKRGENVDDLIKKRKELIKLQKQQMLDSIADLRIEKQRLEVEADKLTLTERLSQLFVKTENQKGKRTKEEQDEIDAKDKEITDLENRLLNVQISELPDAPKVKTPEQIEKEQQRLLDRVNKLQKQALEVSLSKEQKEIQAVKDKYDATIKAAKDAKIDTGIIEEGRREELALIDAKYRKIDLEEFEKNEKRKQEILDSVGVQGLEAKIKAIEDKAIADAKELEDLGAHRDQIEAIYQASEDKIAEIVKKASNKVKKENEESADADVKTAEEVAAAKDAVVNNSVDNISQSFKALAALDEENKGLQAASLIADNLISAAKTIQSTVAANAKATAAFPLTGGQPFVAINTVAAGLGIASSAAATAKGLAALGKGGSTGGATGLDDAGGGPAAPEFNLVEGSESNAIQESIQSGSDPIKAVVISGEITTAQQVDRNIVEGSGI